MKKLVRIYKWVILSVVCQVLILAFFNNVYLVSRGEATATLVDNANKSEPLKKAVKIDIPENSSDIKVSFDNSYISYMLDGNIEIYSREEKKTVKTISYESDEISYYRWLPDRNMVIYAIKAPAGKSGRVQVITYSMDSDVEHAYPKITGIAVNSKIDEIELSPLTNVVYAKVITGTNTAKIYKYDIMSNLSFVMNTNSKTVIKEMNYDNKMVYQDENYKLYVWDGLKASSKRIQFDGKLALLGIVGLDDEIYAGELDEKGMVTNIYYGTSQNTIDKWNKIKLDYPVKPESIYVNTSGNVYEVVEEEKTIYEIKNKSKKTYNGDMIEVFNDHVITREKDKLIIDSIK